MNRLTVLLIFIALTGSVGAVNAQTIITGTVKTATGEPMPGTSIYLKGTNTGVTSDTNGAYRIALPAGQADAILMFSMVGFTTREIPVGQQSRIDVVLEEDAKVLGEVVVTGYMAQERRNLTGAITTVSSEAITRLPLPNIDQALQGRAPGVVVTQNTGAPGEGVAVRVRGAGSINSGNNPLYVVDGVPTPDINAIAPGDIESITVLKDAGATAVYGSRAANGVIIVTTKAGAEGSPRIEFSTQVGVQSPSNMVEMTNTEEYVEMYNEAAVQDNVGKPSFLLRPVITDAIREKLPNVNYLDAIFRSGIIQSHSLSFSGTSGKTRYFISGNYFGQEGIIKSSDYTRISTRLNLDTELKPWLRTGVAINLSKAVTNLIGSSGDGAGGNGGSVIRYAFFRTPAIPIYTATGAFTDKPSDNYNDDNLYTSLFGDGYSPVGMLAYNNNRLTGNRLFGKYFVELQPLPGLKFTTNAAVDYNDSNQRRFDRNWGTLNRINNPNNLSVTERNSLTTTVSSFLNYSLSTGGHNISLLAGTEAVKAQRYDLFSAEQNFPDQTYGLVYLGNGLGNRISDENRSGNALLSFFGKANYDLKGKYIVSATLRRDGSSRFGSDNRWGNFYAGTMGWRIDREAFLEKSSTVDLLMVRAGYGMIGNQEIGDYPFTDLINTGYNYPIGNIRSTGAAVTGFGNSGVRWESSNQLNVGVDVGLWGGKFSASLDFFNKRTNDLLVKQPIASSSGADDSGNNHFVWRNNGVINNRGIELMMTYNGTAGKFKYSVSANAATLENKVIDVDTPIPGGTYGSDFVTLTTKGHPIGSFYLYEMEGIFQNNTEVFVHAFQGNSVKPGDVKYKDQNKDGEINSADRTHLGSPIPKVTAGLNFTLEYGNWDLALFFQGAYGQNIFSVVNRDIEGFYRPFNLTKRYYNERWTGPGTSNTQPRASWDASGNNALIYSSRFLEDGSYTRLKNVQLGYKISKGALAAAKLGIESVRIFFSATNLFTFTKYSGLDPEMTVSNNALGQGDTALGMDWGTYPSARTFNAGLNITF